MFLFCFEFRAMKLQINFLSGLEEEYRLQSIYSKSVLERRFECSICIFLIAIVAI